ncbi:MAG: hypothetical protein KatS3mg096_215 [Candidatus Parcubacteria bacterium]|nr:MAG: hypothetical protein KatS3mg096_215 [Candidatus Parcubacteria bacterium]
MFKKAFTLTEGVIALGILTLSIVFLVSLGNSYLSILNSIRQRYTALNAVQEGLELAIALRNQRIERMDSANWLGVTGAGNYCLYFETNTSRIVANPSSQPCNIGIPGYSRLINYSDFDNPANNDLRNARAVRVKSIVYFFRDRIELDTILTKWSPVQ